MKPFSGVWVFDPEHSQYGEQTVPHSGLYTLVPDGPGLQFHIRWQLEGQPPEQASFSAIPDGQPRVLEGSPVHRELVCSVPTPDTLDTELRQGATVLHHARRVVSGNTMTSLMGERR